MARHRAARATNGQSGFTLIEVMVVITILGLIAAAVAVNVVGAHRAAQHDLVKLDFASIGSAIDVYRVRHARLPDSLAALVADHELKALKGDPWGSAYLYERASDSADGYRLTSLGADGAPGGSGDDADLHSDDPAPNEVR